MAKKKVLIIDDDKEYCELVSLWLQDSFEIRVANDGEAGIDLAREDRPDLILLDVMMPKLSGFSLSWVFRHDPRYAGTIVVFVTALTINKRSREKVDGFLRKPFSRLELLDVIEKALGHGAKAPDFTFPIDEMCDGKRRAPRVDVCIPATFETEGDVHEGMIRSLSPWGAFFETPTELPLHGDRPSPVFVRPEDPFHGFLSHLPPQRRGCGSTPRLSGDGCRKRSLRLDRR